jgi:hypothetical protein
MIPLPRNTTDETGHTYGRLTVQSYAGLLDRKAAWLCRCECGRLATARLKVPSRRRKQIAKLGGAARAGAIMAQ